MENDQAETSEARRGSGWTDLTIREHLILLCLIDTVKVCDSPASSKSIGTIFPTAFAGSWFIWSCYPNALPWKIPGWRWLKEDSHLGGGAGAVSRGLLLESHVADAEVPAGSLPPALALARTVPWVSFPARPADQQWQPAHSQNFGRRHTAESAWQLPTGFSTSSLYSVPLWRSTSVAFQFDSFITPLTSQVPLSIFSSPASPIIA